MITVNEIQKVAAVAAALIAALVSICVLAAKEWLDRRKSKRQASRLLYLYCWSLCNSLESGAGIASDHLTLDKVYAGTADIVGNDNAMMSLSDFEDALLTCRRAEKAARTLTPLERTVLIKKLRFSMDRLKSHEF